MNIGYVLLYQPIISLLFLFYKWAGNLGVAIIGLTILIKIILLPLSYPSMQAAAKMQQLSPQLEKLKKKFGNDKQKLAAAQMNLYRQHRINPAAGCLPQIIQIIILLTLYRVFNDVLAKPDMHEVISKVNAAVYSFSRLPAEIGLNLKFWYLSLDKPDLIKIAGRSFPGFFLLLAVVAQYLSSKLMMPVVKKEEKIAKKTPEAADDFSAAMQKQSLYLFPLMTLLFGFSFPSGLVIYWAFFSLTNLIQQLLMKKNIRSKEGK